MTELETSTQSSSGPADALSKLAQILGSQGFKPTNSIDLTRNLNLHEVTNYESLEELRFIESNKKNRYNESKEDELLRFKKLTQNFDDLITPLNTILKSFNSNLIKLSKELENLQNKSISLSSNLNQRISKENELIPIVSDLIIPTDLIKRIFNEQINKGWCECLSILTDKSEILNTYLEKKEYQAMKSLTQLKILLSNLYLKAVDRVKIFIILKIKALRVINTPSQKIQKDLLDVKEIYKFLQTQNFKLAHELRSGYIFTIRWYYKAYFTRYVQSLQKLKIISFDNSYLLGNEYLNNNTSYFASSKEIKIKVDFAIDRRVQILNELDSTCILAKIAETNPSKFYMELSFKSFIMALMDNGTVEYLFLLDFFEIPETEINSIFDDIFRPIFKIGEGFVKQLIDQNQNDIFGLLNIIKLCTFFQIELQKRKIPILENFLNLTIIIIWPIFQKLIDQNIENLRKISFKSSSVANNSNIHFITAQFTNLVHGIAKVIEGIENFELINKELLKNDLVRLRNELEIKLTKISKLLKANSQEQFLLRNYNYILTIIQDLQSEIIQGEIEHFKLLVNAYKN
ncbi:hypothetical protein WICMUC_001269 [Wickerhamomyces mucosus]|uniref:Vacuolar protein sorting-associated protein 52 n=1 Tax=Wickerhamomyces mucosus TaxID=1378264 RepID=A0A9P8PVG5_9ASCO|nr:hypothetical protein WICMUC_001269 [Wickerhamomyces mucosus]